MKGAFSAAAMAASVFLATAGPQEPDSGRGLVRVAPANEFDEQLWRARLLVPSLDARESAFEDLIARARQERAAEELLERWATGQDELAWTARLALRELRRTGGAMRPQTAPFPRDPLTGPFSRGLFGAEPFSGPDPIEAMHERVRRMLEVFHGVDPFGGLDRFGGLEFDLLPPRPGSTIDSRSFEIRQSPEGVEVEIREDDGSGPRKRTYAGSTLEELLEANPELRERGLRPLVPELEARPDPTGRSHEVLRPDELPYPRSGGGLRRADGKQPVLRTDVLGVYLSTDAEEGKVLVEAVGPGTIADALRLRAGDTILEINGMEVLDAADIRRVLDRRFEGEEVRVKVLTGTGEEEILVWSPR